jgi:hypothetical protein
MTNNTTRAILEQLSDAWCDALQSDLEHGVSCLNAKAAIEFHQKYKAIAKFGELLNDLYIEHCCDD